MGRIYLIRHGQTSGNSEKKFQGRLDNPLNTEGICQAAALARFMEGTELNAVYSSVLLRSKMTAALLAEKKNMSYRCVEGLEEVSFGDWEGLRYDEINRRWPEELKFFFTRPGEWVPPNGETFLQAQNRSASALGTILQNHAPSDNIAIISHGGIIRLTLCNILGMPLNNLWKLNIHNVSVTSINVFDGVMTADIINDFHFIVRSENI